jgi:hypothetical protein
MLMNNKFLSCISVPYFNLKALDPIKYYAIKTNIYINQSHSTLSCPSADIISESSRNVLFRTFHCRYLHLYSYSLLFHLCQSVNIDSNWLREQFCNLCFNML